MKASSLVCGGIAMGRLQATLLSRYTSRDSSVRWAAHRQPPNQRMKLTKRGRQPLPDWRP